MYLRFYCLCVCEAKLAIIYVKFILYDDPRPSNVNVCNTFYLGLIILKMLKTDTNA